MLTEPYYKVYANMSQQKIMRFGYLFINLFTNIFTLGRPITVICILPWRPVKIHKIMAHVQQNTI